jgi:hypothetical protein
MANSAKPRAKLSNVDSYAARSVYSRPCGFEVIEQWRAVASLFDVGEIVARSLCNRFHVARTNPRGPIVPPSHNVTRYFAGS